MGTDFLNENNFPLISCYFTDFNAQQQQQQTIGNFGGQIKFGLMGRLLGSPMEPDDIQKPQHLSEPDPKGERGCLTDNHPSITAFLPLLTSFQTRHERQKQLQLRA
jgi:hypothetical protein